uniref:Agouti signaling protein n=1 Tax=Heterorhabditis bacteriophora TaxID=37862 RepID=A0A1I7X965_HETBA
MFFILKELSLLFLHCLLFCSVLAMDTSDPTDLDSMNTATAFPEEETKIIPTNINFEALKKK